MTIDELRDLVRQKQKSRRRRTQRVLLFVVGLLVADVTWLVWQLLH